MALLIPAYSLFYTMLGDTTPNERANNGETPCHIAQDSAEFDEDYPEELLELFCG